MMLKQKKYFVRTNRYNSNLLLSRRSFKSTRVLTLDLVTREDLLEKVVSLDQEFRTADAKVKDFAKDSIEKDEAHFDNTTELTTYLEGRLTENKDLINKTESNMENFKEAGDVKGEVAEALNYVVESSQEHLATVNEMLDSIPEEDTSHDYGEALAKELEEIHQNALDLRNEWDDYHNNDNDNNSDNRDETSSSQDASSQGNFG